MKCKRPGNEAKDLYALDYFIDFLAIVRLISNTIGFRPTGLNGLDIIQIFKNMRLNVDVGAHQQVISVLELKTKGETNMLKYITVTYMLSILLLGTNAMCEDSSGKEMALTSANAWLANIDNEKYAESWRNAAALLKNAVTAPQLEQSVSTAREPFGKLISRKVTQQDYHTSLPGAPDGSYYVIRFTSKFENKAKAVETITTVKNEDGAWHVSGYFIN